MERSGGVSELDLILIFKAKLMHQEVHTVLIRRIQPSSYFHLFRSTFLLQCISKGESALLRNLRSLAEEWCQRNGWKWAKYCHTFQFPYNFWFYWGMPSEGLVDPETVIFFFYNYKSSTFLYSRMSPLVWVDSRFSGCSEIYSQAHFLRWIWNY